MQSCQGRLQVAVRRCICCHTDLEHPPRSVVYDDDCSTGGLVGVGAPEGSTTPANPKSELVETVRYRSILVRELLATLSAKDEDPTFADAVSDVKEAIRRVNAKIRALGGVATRYDEEPGDG